MKKPRTLLKKEIKKTKKLPQTNNPPTNPKPNNYDNYGDGKDFVLGQASEAKVRFSLHLVYSSCSLKGVENFISSAHENLLTECHIAGSCREHEFSWKSSGSFLDYCSPTPCRYVVVTK